MKLTSILRDSEVSIEGYGYDKITHAYAYGGPELAIKTLNQNFNLDIRNYVTVNFYQMAEIVDAFGGVDIQLTAEEVYSLNENLWNLSQESPGSVVSSDFIPNVNGEIDLINGPYQDGEYHLNGNQAVAYGRIRKIVKADYQRTERQRTVMSKLFEQAKELSVMELASLADDILPLITHNTDQSTVASLLLDLPTFMSYELVLDRIPYDGLYYNRGEMLVPDWEETIERLHENIYGES